MSQIEILPAQSNSPIDFDISRSPSSPSYNRHAFPSQPIPIASRHGESNGSWSPTTTALVNEILSSSPLRLTAADHHVVSADSVARLATDAEYFFPHLPPLYNGHPDIHLRNGIINASQLAADNEPDAEKAFFVADLSQVYRQHLRWKACLPEIQPFYAVKCNPDPYVLRLLAALGAGFDCASNGEISTVLDIGSVEPTRIIFANPCKATSFIRNAAKMGVDMMTFDNVDELSKIARVHPGAKLVVRILTDDTKSLCQLGLKFGAPLVTVPDLLAKARALDLDVVGVSFHVGSGCYDPSVYFDAIRRARDVFDMGKEAGYTFGLLDVGGGFEDALFEEAAKVITGAIDQFFPDRQGLRVIAEPGRFYVSSAFRLATNIIARRAPPNHSSDEPEPGPGPALAPPLPRSSVSGQNAEKLPSVMYYINDGVYGAFNCILFDHQVVHPYVLSLNGSFHVPSSEPLTASSVWGPTCDSIDCVSKSVELPAALRVGDWLGFDNMGAYTLCAASQFNGFEVSKVIYTTGGPGAAEVRKVLSEAALTY